MNTFFSMILAILLLASTAMAQGPGNLTVEDSGIAELDFWIKLGIPTIAAGVLMFWFWSKRIESPRQLYAELRVQVGKMTRLFASVMAPRSHRIIRDAMRLRIWQLECQVPLMPSEEAKKACTDEIKSLQKRLEEHNKRSVYEGLTLGDLVPSSPFEFVIRDLRGDDPTGQLYHQFKTPEGQDVVIPFSGVAQLKSSLKEAEKKRGEQQTRLLRVETELPKLKGLPFVDAEEQRDRLRDELTVIHADIEKKQAELAIVGPESVTIDRTHQDAVVETARALRLASFIKEQFSFPELPMEMPGSGPPDSFLRHLWGSMLGRALFTGYEVDPKTNTTKAVHANMAEWKKAQREYLEGVPKLFLNRDSASNIDNRAMIRNVVAMGWLLAFFHLIAQEEKRTGSRSLDLAILVLPVDELNKLGASYSAKLLDCSSNKKSRDATRIMLDQYATLAKMIDSLPWYHGQESREMASTYVMQA